MPCWDMARKRELAALEARRFAAARLFARGAAQAVVVARFGVRRQTAHQWYQTWKQAGREGLTAAGRLGRRPRLDHQQLARVDTALRDGPRAHGFRTDLWTLPRIAELIERLTGVRYHPGACVVPAPAAELVAPAPGPACAGAQRGGDSAVGGATRASGKQNARRQRAWLVFEDESGISQVPVVRRTWAPRGETPVLTHPFNWQRLSVAVALAFRWDGRHPRLFFQTRRGTYRTDSLIAFLRHLRRHFRRQRVILLWDGLPGHKSAAMLAHLVSQRHWLTAERLPGYAPDLNPVESIFGNVKGRELANHCGPELATLAQALRTGLGRVRRRPHLAHAFVHHAGLEW